MTVGPDDHRCLLHFFGLGCFSDIDRVKAAQVCVTLFPGHTRTQKGNAENEADRASGHSRAIFEGQRKGKRDRSNLEVPNLETLDSTPKTPKTLNG
jgi:hypothetical protein